MAMEWDYFKFHLEANAHLVTTEVSMDFLPTQPIFQKIV